MVVGVVPLQSSIITKMEDESRVTLSQLTARLTEAKRELKQAIVTLDRQLDHTNRITEAGLAGLKVVCDRLKSTIDARYQRVKEETIGARTDVNKIVKAWKECLMKRLVDVTSHKRAIQRTIHAHGSNVVIDMTSVLKIRVDSLDCTSALPDTANTMPSVTLVIDSGVVILIEQHLATFGQVTVIPPVTSVVTDLRVWREYSSTVIGLLSWLIYRCARFKMMLMLSALALVTSGIAVYVAMREDLCFHYNHGSNVVLSNNNQTATLTGGLVYNGGIVIGSVPMTVGYLYQVRIDRIVGDIGIFIAGVVTQDPHTVVVPDQAVWWSSAVVIWSGGVFINGKRDEGIKVGSKLSTIGSSSRVGVLIDDRRSLHLYINGVDQGVAAPAIPHTGYPLFELDGKYRQITALPVEFKLTF